MTLLSRIKALCAEKSITLASLEKTLNFGNGSLSRWDTSSPSADKLQKVAEYFDISTDYLLGNENTSLINGEVKKASDRDIRRIERARSKMSADLKQRMITVLEASFSEYFNDDFEDDDDDE